jgi:hypothetical protein
MKNSITFDIDHASAVIQKTVNGFLVASGEKLYSFESVESLAQFLRIWGATGTTYGVPAIHERTEKPEAPQFQNETLPESWDEFKCGSCKLNFVVPRRPGALPSGATNCVHCGSSNVVSI